MTRAGRQLIGETNIADKAVGGGGDQPSDDDLYLDFDIDNTGKEGDDWEEKELTVENNYEWPVTFEIEFADELDYDTQYTLSRFSRRVARKDGKYVRQARVLSEGDIKLRFRVTEREVPVYDDD
ncbi:MAG: hypothetical protein R3D99_06600 [Altererythrobacter sp.]